MASVENKGTYAYLQDIGKTEFSTSDMIQALEGKDCRLCGDFTPKQFKQICTAYVIRLFEKYMPADYSAEILLVRYGLLQGFGDFKHIVQRNIKYLAPDHKYSDEAREKFKRDEWALRKTQDKALAALAVQIDSQLQNDHIHLFDAVVKELLASGNGKIPDEIVLPTPSYLNHQENIRFSEECNNALATETTITSELIEENLDLDTGISQSDHNFMMIREAGTGEPYQYSLVLEPRKQYEVFVDFDCLNATFAAGDKQPAETIELTFPGKLPAKQQKSITGILHHSNRHTAVEFKPASIISQHNLYVYLSECPDGITVDADQETVDQGKKMKLRIIFGYNDSCVTGLDRFANPLQRLLYKAEDKVADYTEENVDSDYWTRVQRKRRGQFSFCGTPDSVDTKLPSSFFDGMEILLDGATGCFTFEIATCSRWNLITRIRHRIL